MMTIIAYAVPSTIQVVYYHAACLSQLEARNINGLTPGEIARDRATLRPLTSAEVPPGAVCGMSGCKKPLSEAPQAS